MGRRYEIGYLAIVICLAAVIGLPVNASDVGMKGSVLIVEATYGRNCDGDWMRNEIGVPIPNREKFAVEDNNAKEALGKICARKEVCEIEVTPEAIGFDPAFRCGKDIEAVYRCFSYDRTHEASARDGKTLVLDCDLSKR